MTYLITPLIGLLITLTSLLCPVLMLLALPFIRWDLVPSTGQWGTHPVIRGSLPGWLSWLETPDERLPGGLYEDAHRALYECWGKWVASYVWLGWRNRLHGLGYALGKPAIWYDTEQLGMWTRKDDGIWKYTAQVGPLRFVMGWGVYKRLDGTFWAAPVCSIKSRPQ